MNRDLAWVLIQMSTFAILLCRMGYCLISAAFALELRDKFHSKCSLWPHSFGAKIRHILYFYRSSKFIYGMEWTIHGRLRALMRFLILFLKRIRLYFQMLWRYHLLWIHFPRSSVAWMIVKAAIFSHGWELFNRVHRLIRVTRLLAMSYMMLYLLRNLLFVFYEIWTTVDFSTCVIIILHALLYLIDLKQIKRLESLWLVSIAHSPCFTHAAHPCLLAHLYFFRLGPLLVGWKGSSQLPQLEVQPRRQSTH